MTTPQIIAARLANLGAETLASERSDTLDAFELELLAEPFEGLACSGPERLSDPPGAFPILMALASSGHRAWAHPRDESVVVVVCDLERRAVFVASPFFDPKDVEYPDDSAESPSEPRGTDAESRLVDVQRIDLTEVLGRTWASGRHRVWLLSHDWCSNPWDVEVPGAPTSSPPSAVAPLPTDGAVTFTPPQALEAPDTPGIALQITTGPQPGPKPGPQSGPKSVRLSAALHAVAEAVHVPAEAVTTTESDGDHSVTAVIPCTLVLTSAAGGAPQVLQMGVASYGPAPALGQPVHAGFVLELTEVFGLSEAEHLLWAWVEGSLHGPVVVR